MTKEEIIEGNKLIAEFMDLNQGWAYHEEDEIGFGFTKYYKSWDWLIPVFQKIENTFELSPQINFGCGIKIWTDGTEENAIKLYSEVKEDTDIIVAWKAVVKAIKWYNKTK